MGTRESGGQHGQSWQTLIRGDGRALGYAAIFFFSFVAGLVAEKV